MTDTAAYSDLIFGLFRLLGFQFSPRLADLGRTRFWRINRRAEYGPLNSLARSRINLKLIRSHWDDILLVARLSRPGDSEGLGADSRPAAGWKALFSGSRHL